MGSFALYGKELTEPTPVKIDVNGVIEEVWVDPHNGPYSLYADGSSAIRPWYENEGYQGGGLSCRQIREKQWSEMTITQKECWVHVVAKRNRAIKNRCEKA